MIGDRTIDFVKVLGNATGGLYTVPEMPTILTKCAACGKEFNRYPEWIYRKLRPVADSNRKYEYEYDYF